MGVVEDGHQQVPVCPLGAAAALPLEEAMSMNERGGQCWEGPLPLTLTLTDLFLVAIVMIRFNQGGIFLRDKKGENLRGAAVGLGIGVGPLRAVAGRPVGRRPWNGVLSTRQKESSRDHPTAHRGARVSGHTSYHGTVR